MLERGWGARVTEAMGVGDIGVSLFGECEEQDGMHLGARGFVHAELIDPDQIPEGAAQLQPHIWHAQLVETGRLDEAAAVYQAALAKAGKLLGFHVTVVDAREIFATRKRFPDADEIVVDWPHRWLASQQVDARTVICVLTHDPKFDVPALKVAVSTKAAYIGAMGSRRTHEDRTVRLKEAGLTDEEIARIHSPIGLDLGARTPEETAISIAAEIVQSRWGGSGANLRRSDGPIHAGAPR